MDRREFLELAGAGGVAIMGGAESPALRTVSLQTSDRDGWVAMLRKLADPVCNNLAAGTLKSRMPVEQPASGTRQTVTHLEAVGRLLAGIAPWLELSADETPEGRL